MDNMTSAAGERCLTFALGKGRLAQKALELFGQLGIDCREDRKSVV